MPRLFHYTDSAHLPWIIASGELRPSNNRIGGFPDDFLWATTDEKGDRTATVMYGPFYRSGSTFLVRMELDPAGFLPWTEARAGRPGWTEKHVQALHVAAAKHGADSSKWWCSTDPVSMAAVKAIDGKSYSNNSWRPLGEPAVLRTVDSNGTWLGVEFGGRSYYSTKRAGPQGQDAYMVGYGASMAAA